MKPLSHSHSSIRLYEQCPLKYYYLRVAKKVTSVMGEEAAYGNEVHKAFENRLKGDSPLPDTLKKWEPTLARFAPLELGVEEEIVLDEELKVIEGSDAWFSPAAWFRCKIDLRVCLTPSSLLVIDWKTGKRKPDYDQLELSALCLFTKFPEVQVIVATFAWLKAPELGLNDQRTYTRDMINVLWAKHLARVRPIYVSQEYDNWPAKPSGLCQWRSKDGRSGQCEAFTICPHGGR